MLGRMPTESSAPIGDIQQAFGANDLEKVVRIMNSLLKDVPSTLLKDKMEDFYHALVHLHFKYLGLLMDSEVHTSDGRMDAVVKTNTHIYIIEFKINKKPEVAMQQLKDKAYADKFGTDARQIVLLGISFDTRRRAIKGWLKEEVQR